MINVLQKNWNDFARFVDMVDYNLKLFLELVNCDVNNYLHIIIMEFL
jgi:hypothetical protein